MDIEEEETGNVTQGCLLPGVPVEIAMKSRLAHAIKSDSFFIRMYEITSCPKSDNPKPRFLATMGIFTCIAIFGWSPTSGRAFAAHVPSSACHYAITQKRRRQQLLPQITKTLQWTFRKEDISSVRIHLVGGQEFQDLHDRLLHSVFVGEQRRFSWHVKQAVLDSGVKCGNIDETYLNVFPGMPFEIQFEQKQASKNQSFQMAALDRETGTVVVHTKATSTTHYIVPALESRGIIETNRYAEGFLSHPREGKECEYIKAGTA